MKASYRLPIGMLLPASLTMFLLLGLPVALIVLRAATPNLLGSLVNPTVYETLRLSLLTTGISLSCILLFGTPLAYLLAHYTFPLKRLLNVLIDLPLVLPPTVAGVGLLLTFGRRGLIGSYLSELNINLAFTTTAVVLAQIFVSAPLYVRAMKLGFAAISEQVGAAALTLGASRWRMFWQITLPLSIPAMIEGIVLAWARAIGEFGATIVFAGSFSGRTQTMPLAIYAALESDLNVALTLSAILSVVAFILLFLFRQLIDSEYSP